MNILVGPGQITFTDNYVFNGLVEERTEPLLLDMIRYCGRQYGVHVIKTYTDTRKFLNDPHHKRPLQAVDFSLECYPSTNFGYQIVNDLNSRYVFDRSRPSLMVAVIRHTRKDQKPYIHVETGEKTMIKSFR